MLSETEAGHVRVAFATQDLHSMDAHFASARNLAIYDVSTTGYHLVEAIRFDTASAEEGVHAADDDRIASRLQAIEGCNLLFVLAIGGPAAARVVGQRVHPMKLPKPEPITDVLDRLRVMLNGSPPPWLRKALKPAGNQQAAFVDDEDDDR